MLQPEHETQTQHAQKHSIQHFVWRKPSVCGSPFNRLLQLLTPMFVLLNANQWPIKRRQQKQENEFDNAKHEADAKHVTAVEVSI